ncbi:MAG: substrate-binding domain-containing protein, partial [Bacteroidota bacterium]
DITNPFFSTLARGVEDAAREAGYPLILGNTDESAAREREHLGALMSHQINGLVIAPTVGSEAHLRRLAQRRIPFVLVDRRVPGVEADLVRGDTEAGAQQLVRHLVEQGYRRIAFVGGTPQLSSLEDRLGGYRAGVREAGLDEEVRLSGYLLESGRETAEALLADGDLPEAVLAANNVVAAGVLAVFRERGVRVPQDVALACVDEAESSLVVGPLLTVVRQPAFEMGRRAMALLADRIGGAAGPPREVVLPTELVVRHSTGGR